MTAIIRIDPNGTIQLPREILAHVKPNTPYAIHAENARLVLEPATEQDQPFWKTATPQQRAERFRQWANSHKSGPGLPNSAFGRDSIYD
ncbi:MAG TPA: hypothetical protein VGF13_04800 [Verrucomicrobiae bacterium]|jgi:hypothetical protein